MASVSGPYYPSVPFARKTNTVDPLETRKQPHGCPERLHYRVFIMTSWAPRGNLHYRHQNGKGLLCRNLDRTQTWCPDLLIQDARPCAKRRLGEASESPGLNLTSNGDVFVCLSRREHIYVTYFSQLTHSSNTVRLIN